MVDAEIHTVTSLWYGLRFILTRGWESKIYQPGQIGNTIVIAILQLT